MVRFCPVCNVDISSAHKNRKYCSQKCSDKARYKRVGQRSTPEQRRAWYEARKKKPGYVEKLREQGRKRNNKVKRFMARYKLLKGCADCGYKKHHVALDFDHVKGEKEINLSFAKSINQAKEEIRKCEVVCSNCHRIRTYNRIHENKQKRLKSLE